MRPILIVHSMAALTLSLALGSASAQTTAKLVESTKIWDQAPHNALTDLVRFQERWFCVCREGSDEYSQDGAVRVLTSTNGTEWESAALIQSTTPGRGLYSPRLAVTADGQLMVSATGIVPTPGVPEPLPKYGGTLQTMGWFSQDGRAWSRTHYIGAENYPLSRVFWHNDTAYGYAAGCICGSMQTIEIVASPTGKQFQGAYKRTFGGFFPGDASLAFAGDEAYCLMSRASTEIGNPLQPGYLGKARAPFSEWEWTDLGTRISHPNLLRLSDGRIIAAVGLYDPKSRTAICEFDPAASKLTELVVIPTNGSIDVGLVEHDGHVWVSYHAEHQRKQSVFLAKVLVGRP